MISIYETGILYRLLRGLLQQFASVVEFFRKFRFTPVPLNKPIDIFILFEEHLGMGDMIMLSPLIKTISGNKYCRSCYIDTSWPVIFDLPLTHLSALEMKQQLKQLESGEALIVSPTMNLRHSLFLFSRHLLLGYFSSRSLYSDISNTTFFYDSKDSHYNQRILPLLNIFNESVIGVDSYPQLVNRKPKLDRLKNYIVIAPYLRTETRRWPSHKFIALISYITTNFNDHVIYIVGASSKDEKDYNEQFQLNDQVIDITGELTLLELNYLISHADIFVGNDSGPAHISYLANCLSIVIFGSVDPKNRLPLGFYNNYGLYNADSCQYFPCYDSNERPSCINLEKYICIKELDINMILRIISEQY